MNIPGGMLCGAILGGEILPGQPCLAKEKVSSVVRADHVWSKETKYFPLSRISAAPIAGWGLGMV